MPKLSFRIQENIYKDYVEGESVLDICETYNIELEEFLYTMYCLGGKNYNPNKWNPELMEYVEDKFVEKIPMKEKS